MKKLAIIVISIVFCLPFLTKAQDAATFKPFSFGLKAIPSLSFMKTDSKDFKNTKPSLNFGYGLLAEFNFAPNYGFLTGIEVNGNSANMDYTPVDAKMMTFHDGDTLPFYLTSRKYTIKYLNIPLLLKLKTNEIGFLKYYGQFGVDAGFRLNAKVNDMGVDSSKTDVKTVPDYPMSDDVNLIRLALNIGLGVEYNLAGSTSLVCGLNYSNAFTNFLNKESKYLQIEKGTVRTRLLQNAYNSYIALTVGILF